MTADVEVTANPAPTGGRVAWSASSRRSPRSVPWACARAGAAASQRRPRSARHLSTLIGLNTAVAGLARLLAAPASPHLTARFGIRGTLFLAIAAAAASAVGFYVFQPFWTWFPLRLVFHFAVSHHVHSVEFWISSVSPPSRRGLILGIYATVLALGFALGAARLLARRQSGLPAFGLGAAMILSAAVRFCSPRAARRSGRDADGAVPSLYLGGPERHLRRVRLRGGRVGRACPVSALRAVSIGFSEGGAARLLSVIASAASPCRSRSVFLATGSRIAGTSSSPSPLSG